MQVVAITHLKLHYENLSAVLVSKSLYRSTINELEAYVLFKKIT